MNTTTSPREVLTVPVLEIKPGDLLLVADEWREPHSKGLWSPEGRYVIIPLIGGGASMPKLNGTVQVSRILSGA